MVGAISIDVYGEKAMAFDLERLAGRAFNLHPAFDAIHEDLVESVRAQFMSEGLHGSRGWTPITEAWAARKASAGLDPRIMFASEALYHSLTDIGSDDHLWTSDNDSFSFGSRLPYAGAHHNPQRPGYPQRRLLQLTMAEKRQIAKRVQNYVMVGYPVVTVTSFMRGGRRVTVRRGAGGRFV